jgi:hypothetical protein
MITRIGTAIFILLFATAVAQAETELIVSTRAVYSEEPTSMPDYCLDRDVNCVLNDGLPRPAVIVRDTSDTTPTATGAAADSTPGSADAGAQLAR